MITWIASFTQQWALSSIGTFKYWAPSARSRKVHILLEPESGVLATTLSAETLPLKFDIVGHSRSYQFTVLPGLQTQLDDLADG
eukprot:942258-Rhodomonas_salina.1